MRRSAATLAALVLVGSVPVGSVLVAGAAPAGARAAGDGSTTTLPQPPPGTRTGQETFTGADGSERRVLITKPPSADGSTPAVVLVHGGGWFSGEPEDMQPWADVLADQGWVAFSIEYQLAGRDGSAPSWPEALEDVTAGTRWVHANARRWGADPDELIVFGESAGGHLTFLLSQQGAGDDVPIAAIASWSGPIDVAALVPPVDGGPVPGCGDDAPCQEGWETGAALWFMGCRPDACPDDYAAADPLDGDVGAMPPVWFANATEELVPLAPAQELADRLDQEGVDHHLQVVEGAAHAHGYAAQVWNLMVPWLADQVGEPRPSVAGFPGRQRDRLDVVVVALAAAVVLAAGLALASWHQRRQDAEAHRAAST